MNAEFDLKSDLDELVQTAYRISATREEDADDALQTAREQQLGRGELQALETRVARILKAGSALTAEFQADRMQADRFRSPHQTPNIHPTHPSHLYDQALPIRRTSLRSARLRVAALSRMPHRGAATLLLLVISLPMAGLALGGLAETTTRTVVHVPIVVRENHSFENMFGPFPNHLVTVAGQGVLPSYGGGDSSSIIRTDNLSIRVKPQGVESAASAAAAYVNTANIAGVVVSKSHSGPHSGITLTLRVPEKAYGIVLTKLYSLGVVEAENQRSQNVGLQEVNLAAKLNNLVAQRKVLLALFNRSRSVSDTIHVQQTLSGVQSGINTTQADIRYLGNQIAMSTITVTFQSTAPQGTKVQPASKGPIANTLSKSVHAAGRVVGGTIILVGYALPLAVLVLIGYGAFILFRRKSGQRS